MDPHLTPVHARPVPAHERAQVEPIGQEDRGQPILPHDHHSVIAQLAGAQVVHPCGCDQIQPLLVYCKSPGLYPGAWSASVDLCQGMIHQQSAADA